MVYNVINSKVVSARIASNYTIDNTDWINLVPMWISDAISEIGCYPSLKSYKSDAVEVLNHIAKLPANMKLLIGIIYEGCRLPQMGKKVGQHSDLIEYADHNYASYELQGDNYISTTFETGEVVFIYKQLPVEQDENTGLWYPLIPEKYEVYDAIEKFILFKILQKGYKVTGFNLSDMNPATNPFLYFYGNDRLAVIGAKKKASNSVIQLDPDTRKQLSDTTRTFVYDYNRYHRDLLTITTS